MFYRLYSSLDYQYQNSWVLDYDGEYAVLNPNEFEMLAEDVTPISFNSRCRLLMAPNIDQKKFSAHMMLGSEPSDAIVPDIYTSNPFLLVSDKFLNLVQEDISEYVQVWDAKIVDKEKVEINLGRFYWMCVKSLLRIDVTDCDLENVGFRPTQSEKKLGLFQKQAELRVAIEKYPIWKLLSVRDAVFLNEDIVRKLEDAQITGIDRVTESQNEWESLAVI
ncbi:MAG: hypothetical protein AAGL24_27585 [Pseudomonadota bacterium]